MNILIICPSFKPVPAVDGGAIENLVDDYLKYNSDKKKYQITVYSSYSKNISNKEIQNYKNTVFRHVKKDNKRYNFYRVITKIMRSVFHKKQIPTAYSLYIVKDLKRRKELEKYDLIIIENQVESLIFYRKAFKSKIVEHLHNDYINLNTKCVRKIIDSCDEFWCVSKFISEQIKKINGNAKTRILYNGVDSKKFNMQISDERKMEMYNKLGFNENDYIILYVGRIMPEKGVLQLMQAFNNIKSKEDKLKLLIVGGKKNNSPDILNYYKSLIAEKMRNDSSICLYGDAKIDELRTLYSIAKVQVVPSIWEEAFGLIVVEGMCMKKTLIVTNSGGIPEIVGNSAIIVDRKNLITNLEKAIKECYNSNDDEKNYNDIIEKFSLKRYCENFEKYIENN